MKLNDLKPSLGGGTTKKKRVGRGIGSGHGKTSGRGQKGQKARSKVRMGFEGGQTPLFQRLPKRGFTNVNKRDYAIVNIEDLADLAEGTIVTPELLVKEKIVKQGKIIDGVKVLGSGEIDVKLTVQAHKFSKSAAEKIEAAGGKVEVI